MREGGTDSGAFTLIFVMGEDEAGEVSFEIFQNGVGTVIGAVIDDNNLVRGEGGGGVDFMDDMGEGKFFVIGGDDNREFH